MRGLVTLLLLALVACAAQDSAVTRGTAPAVSGWQEANGKAPSQAEFAALVAACRDREQGAQVNGGLNGCLADLGLQRTP